MNILILTPIFPFDNWTYGIFVQEQAKALSSVNQVTVIAISIDTKQFKLNGKPNLVEEIRGDLKVIKIVIPRSLPIYNQFHFLKNMSKAILSKIAQEKFDLIHCHYSYPSGIIGYLLKQKLNIPYIISEHSQPKGIFRSYIHKKIAIFALNRADVVLAVSPFLKKEFERYTSNKIEVVYNLIDTSNFHIDNHKSQDQKINIGFLGVLFNDIKGLDVLFEALHKISNPNICLHIGGYGPSLEYYKEMARDLGVADKCIFYGKVNIEDTPDFYSKLDFFVLPSRYETFGIVLIEAMACGLPVVATRCGGPEYIVTEETGILVEKENVYAMTSALQKMIDTFSLYKPETIRAYVDENFSKHVFLTRINSIYSQIIK